MNIFHIILVGIVSFSVSAETQNFSCYQCVRNSSEECDPQDLRPCPRAADRCVTHISKQENTGYLIKRECGLGPCGFEDDMVNKGLGMNGCDKSKVGYFCIFCCRTDGCNKSGSQIIFGKDALVMLILVYTMKNALL